MYETDKNNIATIIVDKSGVKMYMAYAEKNVLYDIKKEWKQNIISK